MHILLNKMTSNSTHKKIILIFACPETTWRPVAPEPRDLPIQKILKLGKINHPRMILSLITYPLSPKIKPLLSKYYSLFTQMCQNFDAKENLIG